MKLSPAPLILATVLTLSLPGCRKDDTVTAPGAPPGAPGSPSAPGPTGGAGTAADTDRSVGQVSEDAVMTGKVKNALIVSKVDTSNLNVDTVNGVVTLKGSVPTASQKASAEKVAKQVEGVSSVKNSLTVGAAQ